MIRCEEGWYDVGRLVWKWRQCVIVVSDRSVGATRCGAHAIQISSHMNYVSSVRIIQIPQASQFQPRLFSAMTGALI